MLMLCGQHHFFEGTTPKIVKQTIQLLDTKHIDQLHKLELCCQRFRGVHKRVHMLWLSYNPLLGLQHHRMSKLFSNVTSCGAEYAERQLTHKQHPTHSFRRFLLQKCRGTAYGVEL
jgi:hypothetical protein